ncbi:MAG TPA: DinB family protein [Flavisolibacter sp.]|nr:DinB family protein [Flavisolibacter sp.]
MKELLLQLAGYHYWADQQLIDIIQQLPEEKQSQIVPSSFDSLLKTTIHMWDAESIWWQRLKLSERIIVPSASFTGNFKDAANQLLVQNKQWIEWISNAQEHMFQHEFIYLNSKKEQFKQPVYQVLMHVFNHGTYHRGQLITILRQLNVEKITQTDFIAWTRKSR